MRPIEQLEKWVLERMKMGDTVLDLGCGTKRYWSAIEWKASVMTGLDAFNSDGINPEITFDMETGPLPFQSNSFDLVLMIDVVEHLTRETGIRIIEEAKQITTREILLLTPLKFDANDHLFNDIDSAYYQNTHNFHQSLWSPDDFLGWERTPLPFTVQKKRYYLGTWRKE